MVGPWLFGCVPLLHFMLALFMTIDMTAAHVHTCAVHCLCVPAVAPFMLQAGRVIACDMLAMLWVGRVVHCSIHNCFASLSCHNLPMQSHCYISPCSYACPPYLPVLMQGHGIVPLWLLRTSMLRTHLLAVRLVKVVMCHCGCCVQACCARTSSQFAW